MAAVLEAEQANRAAECSLLQDKLLRAEQRQEDLRVALEASSSQLASLQQQEHHARQKLANSNAAVAELSSSKASLQLRCSSLASHLEAMQPNASSHQSQGSSTLQADSAAVLQLLERQLVSLSDMLKGKEQQIAALQQTVQQQCDERTLMHIKQMQLESALRHQHQNPLLEGGAMQPTAVSSPAVQKAAVDAGSNSPSSSPRGQQSIGKGASEKPGSSTQGRGKLNRLASASEQQHGKSGLLGRIMATSSTTGQTV